MGLITVRDGKHRGQRDLAQNVRRKVSPEYRTVLAALHEIGKGFVDRFEQRDPAFVAADLARWPTRRLSD